MRGLLFPSTDEIERETWPHWLRASISRIWSGWLLRRAVRATEKALLRLDDRMLHDIGLERSEIMSVAAAVTLASGPKSFAARRTKAATTRAAAYVEGLPEATRTRFGLDRHPVARIRSSARC